MRNQEIRNACIAKLHLNGVRIADTARTPSIVSAISKLTGKSCAWNLGMADFMAAFLAPQKAAVYVAPFRKMRPHTHPRLAEIERAQPPMLTPCGKGNGGEQSKAWYR